MVEIQGPDFGLNKFLEGIVAQGHEISIRKPADVSEGADRWDLIEVNYQPKPQEVARIFRGNPTFQYLHDIKNTLKYTIVLFDGVIGGVKKVEGKVYEQEQKTDNISATVIFDIGVLNYSFLVGPSSQVLDFDINFASLEDIVNKDLPFEDFAAINRYTLAEVRIGYMVEEFRDLKQIRWGSFIAEDMVIKHAGTNLLISVKDVVMTTPHPTIPTEYVNNPLPLQYHGPIYDLRYIADDGVLVATKKSDTEIMEIRFPFRIKEADFFRLEQAIHTDTQWLDLSRMNPRNRPILSYSKSVENPGK